MNSRIPIITYIFNRYKKASLTKKASVEIRITYNRKQKYISTGVFLYSNQWKNNHVVNTPDALQLNQLLSNFLSDIRQIILKMSESNNIDIFNIPKELEKLKANKISFIDYCKQRAEVRKYGKSKDSQERYDRFIKFFIEYGRIKNFDDITDLNIIAYDVFLSNKQLKPYSKWNNYHRFLNSFILDAIDDGFLTRNPYKWINIEKGKDVNSITRHLYPEEFKALMMAEMPTESTERIRDIFVFQTYLCLSYADLKNFKKDMITEINGIKVYTGHREKNGKPFTVPVLKPALLILEKYNYKLPVISNVKYNAYLKVVAHSSGIDKPVSTHWARHTGATLLLNEGVDLKIVSKICGHSSIKITEQIYARLLDETVVKAVFDIEDII